CEPRSYGELGVGGEFAGRDLGSVGRLHAQNLDAAVGANDGETVGRDLDDLAHLAGNSFGVMRRQGLRFEYLQRLPIQGGPSARRRIAAADEIVDLPPGFAPVDAGIVRPATALVCR